MRFWTFFVAGVLLVGCSAQETPMDTAPPEEETRSIEMTVVAELPPDEVFDLWSTEEGARRFFAPAAEIGAAVGDPYVIIFDPESDPEGADHGTKGSSIRALESGRHIAFGWTFPPFGDLFNTQPFPTWVEVSIDAFAKDPTRSLVRFAHRGFPVDPAWDEVFTLFRDGNWPLVMNRFLVYCRDGVSPAWGDPEGEAVRRVLLKERVVDAQVAEVWEKWTTAEGLESFLCERAEIDLAPGGSYEVLLSLDAPEGERGCEGCQVVAVEPQSTLVFTWNLPPSIPRLRFEKTNVSIDLEMVEPGRTRVRLLSLGWGTGEEWEAGYAYFDRAWPTVLDWLAESVGSGREADVELKHE